MLAGYETSVDIHIAESPLVAGHIPSESLKDYVSVSVEHLDELRAEIVYTRQFGEQQLRGNEIPLLAGLPHQGTVRTERLVKRLFPMRGLA